MSDIKLFRYSGNNVIELEGRSAEVEKSLQTIIENNLEAFLGVRFLATEYTTGKIHRGRIDTLGIDENNCPVIIEYKRHLNENVITQGLFYLSWLMDHKAEFQILVQNKIGSDVAEAIEWQKPRLLCIAGDFSKFDSLAVQQMERNIELMRYRLYGDDMLLLEMLTAITDQVIPDSDGVITPRIASQSKTVSEYYEQSDADLKSLYDTLRDYISAIADDVQLTTLKNYFAFKRIKNFACVEIHPTSRKLLVYVKASFSNEDLERFTILRDVTNIGHFGTGNLEITIKSSADFEIAKPFINASYEAS